MINRAVYLVVLYSVLLGQVQGNSFPILCGPGEYTCLDGSCIPLDWLCDGTPDCLEGSDEMENCSSCATYEYHCNTKDCILAEWRCDREVDCIDGSDEINCTYPMDEKRVCNPNEYMCDIGDCVSLDKLCNGFFDCNDTTDENGTCGQKQCSPNNANCSHQCQNTPKGPLCVCPSGFRLDADNKTCHDVDECREGLDTCSQICDNTIGGFKCSCVTGYNVTDDGNGCVVNGYDLLFTIDHRLFVLSSLQERPSPLLPIIGTGEAMGYDYHTMSIFFADRLLNVIYKANLHGLWTDTEIVVQGTERVEGIAVDWLARNLYWTDDGKDTIEVATLSGQYRTVLVNTGLDKPRAIALDPQGGYMYWTDWGLEAKIERSHMDGRNRQVLVTSRVTWPNSIALDLPNNRFYWSDGKRGLIESVSLNGTNRRSLFIGKRAHPFSIAIFGDHVIWTDFMGLSLEMADKRTGHDKKVLMSTAKQITNLLVMHHLLNPDVPNPCQVSTCPHLCLLSPNGISCACQGMKSATDHKNCSEDQAETVSNQTQPTTQPSHSERPSTDYEQLSTPTKPSTEAAETSTTTTENVSTTTRPDINFHKKSKIFWNRIKKTRKKNKHNSPTKNTASNDEKTDKKKQNFTDDDSLCLSEICRHLGICDFGDMRSKENVESNCTCVERMKGNCGTVITKKTGRKLQNSDINSNKVLLHVVLSVLLAAGFLLTIRIWRKLHKAMQPAPRAEYKKTPERITITNLTIEDVDFDDVNRRTIYNDAGYDNPIFGVTEIEQQFDVSVEEKLTVDKKVAPVYSSLGYSNNKFQYSPINNDDDDDDDDRDSNVEFHQFVNPVYKSPGN